MWFSVRARVLCFLLKWCFSWPRLAAKRPQDGFESFVNQRHNKPAEMIAKYMDLKLRTGYKVE